MPSQASLYAALNGVHWNLLVTNSHLAECHLMHLWTFAKSGSSIPLSSSKVPRDFNNSFASNKQSLDADFSHFFRHWLPIGNGLLSFSFDLTSNHCCGAVNFGYTACQTTMKTLNRHLIFGRLVFGYVFCFSSWKAHKSVKRSGTLLGKASFHLDCSFSVSSGQWVLEPILTGRGVWVRLNDRVMLGSLLSVVSLSAWEPQ